MPSPVRQAALGGGRKTLSESEILARSKNRYAERTLVQQVRHLSQEEQGVQHRIQREVRQWRDFRRHSVRTSGVWLACPQPGDSPDTPRSATAPKDRQLVHRSGGDSLLPPRPTTALSAGVPAEPARTLAVPDEALCRLQRPWVYTYTPDSHNSLYNEAAQEGRGQRTRLYLRRASSSATPSPTSPHPHHSFFRSRSSVGDVRCEVTRPQTRCSTPGVTLKWTSRDRLAPSVCLYVDRPRPSGGLCSLTPTHTQGLTMDTNDAGTENAVCGSNCTSEIPKSGVQLDHQTDNATPEVTKTKRSLDTVISRSNDLSELSTFKDSEVISNTNQGLSHTETHVNGHLSGDTLVGDDVDGEDVGDRKDNSECISQVNCDANSANKHLSRQTSHTTTPSQDSAAKDKQSTSNQENGQVTHGKTKDPQVTAKQAGKRVQIQSQARAKPVVDTIPAPEAGCGDAGLAQSRPSWLPKDSDRPTWRGAVKQDHAPHPPPPSSPLQVPAPRQREGLAALEVDHCSKTGRKEDQKLRKSVSSVVTERRVSDTWVFRQQMTSDGGGSGALARRYSEIDSRRRGSFMKFVEHLDALREHTTQRLAGPDIQDGTDRHPSQAAQSPGEKNDHTTNGKEVTRSLRQSEKQPLSPTHKAGAITARRTSNPGADTRPSTTPVCPAPSRKMSDSVPCALKRVYSIEGKQPREKITFSLDEDEEESDSRGPTSELSPPPGKAAGKLPSNRNACSQSDFTVFKGFKIRNYIPPQRRYRTAPGMDLRRERWLVRLSMGQPAPADQEPEGTRGDVIISKASRKKVLKELVDRNNQPTRAPDTGAVPPKLRAKIDEFFKTIEPYCPKPEVTLD